MRTENIHGFSSILLAFAIVLSMAISVTFTSPPVVADSVDDWPGKPGGVIPDTYNVVQGNTFLLRHRMNWDELGVPGYYLVAIWWDYYDLANNAVGDNGRTFTLVSATAYIDNDYDNVPDAGLILDNSVSTGDNGTRYTIGVSNAAGNDNDGYFNVDIVLRAAGPDGTPHDNTDNHPINYTIMQSLESVPPSAVVPLVTVVISEWTKGVIVSGKDGAYNVDGAGILPFKDYVAGDNPPIVVAQKVDDGAVVAGGISSSSRNWRWNDTSPLNPDPHLDNLLDAAFQWMVPGAANVLWWDHPDVYNDTGQCSQLVDAITALGYTVYGDDRELENMYTGYSISYSGTIIENILASDDQYAIENDPTSAGSDSSDVHIGRFTYEDNTRSFIKWDFSGLSSPTSISSATIILDTYYDPDNDMTAGFYVCDDAWNEDNMCWDNMPTTPITGDTNFNDAYTFATEWDNYAQDTFDYLGWHAGGLGLFISEYIEGSSYNKALEIYTDSTVDLSNYQVELYSNGSATITSSQVLSGTLESSDVYVMCHGSAAAAIQAVADLTSGTCNWNGDDGIVLRRISDNAVIDAIGQYNVDPGSEWPPADGGGANQTQVRRTSQIASLDMVQVPYGAWWNVDVTSYVQGEFAGDGVVSIMIKSENEDLPPEEQHSCQFAASERSAGIYGPFLEVTYEGTIDKVYDYGLENMDILVINQLQRGTGFNGGDPSLVTATELSIIDNFVSDGGGLLITDGGDYGGYNYCLVGNKILDTLGVDWWFQHDQTYDNIDNWGALYEIVTDVDVSSPIGMMYEASTTGSPGKTTVGLYSTSTMVATPVNTNVSVSVAPALQSDGEDSDFTYTATINNTGPSNDRFWLTVSDDQGWENVAVSPSYLDIGTGGSDTATVTVSIPVGTPYCTYDTLTVTATSNLNPAVSANNTAQAHSTGIPPTLRGVEVEIHPDSQEAVLVIDYDAVKKRYDPLTFKVIVANTGDLWDKYVITAETDSDKILELWPTELFLQPGENDFVVLSVTVPENEVGSNTNTITVEAEGTFADNIGEDTENAKAFDTCTVHIAEAYCVRLDVWPFQTQSATPGSKVRWIARVKNLGNTTNFYTIEASGIVYDYQGTIDTIDPVVEPPYVELPPCNWAQVVIDIVVPENLEMSTRIDVTVSVTSQYGACYDEATVDVHVVRGIPPIPQGVIKLEVEAELLAIQVWPTYWDFGVLDETETASTPADYFTVRNIGNTPVDVTIAGNDAYSSPGELTTTWVLDDLGNIGLDRYTMDYDSTLLTKAGSLLVGNLVVSQEYTFDLTLTAPSSISVPSRMWTLVNLTAVKA